MKRAFFVSILLLVSLAGAALALTPVGFTPTDAVGRALTERCNAFIAEAQEAARGGGIALAIGEAGDLTLLADVLVQEEDGARFGQSPGKRDGASLALTTLFQLLSGLDAPLRGQAMPPDFTPRRYDALTYRALAQSGQPRLDALIFAFQDVQSGNRLEDADYLALRFFEESGRVTLYVTSDPELLMDFTAAPAKAAPAASPLPTPPPTVTIREGKTVNLRQEPRKDSKALGWAQGGGTYPLLSTAENGWVEIEIEGGKRGYVSPKLLK